MKRLMIFISVLLLGMVGCQKSELGLSDLSQGEGTILNGITGVETRLNLEDTGRGDGEGIVVSWRNRGEDVDRITIYNATTEARVGNYTYSGSDGATSGQFIADAGVSLEDGAYYVAIFPASSEANLEDARISRHRYGVQEGANPTMLEAIGGSIKMEGSFTFTAGNIPDIAFENMSTVYTMDFSGIDKTPVSVTVINGAASYRQPTVELSGISAGEDFTCHIAIDPHTRGGRSIYFIVGYSDLTMREFRIDDVFKDHNAGIRYIMPVNTLAESTRNIASAQEFAAFASEINAGGRYTGLVQLSADIDLSTLGVEWTPIEAYGQYYGIFNGAGHSVSNLKISETNSANGNYQVGLFADISNSTLCNLNLVDPEISITSNNVGGIVGYCYFNITIENCAVIGGNITNLKDYGSIGGITGMLNSSIVYSCYNSAHIKSLAQRSNIGGIAGYITDETALIECSYNIGTVEGSTIEHDNNVGGIVGTASYSPTIKSVYSAGKLIGDRFRQGVCRSGYSSTTISNAYYIAPSALYDNDGSTYLVSVEQLNAEVSAGRLPGFTAGSPSTQYLPSLRGEQFELPAL